MMTTVFDLDNTLIENNLHLVAADMVGEYRDEPTDYGLKNLCKEVRNKTFELYENPTYMCQLPAFKGVVDHVKNMANHSKLYILTARPSHLRNGTIFMVQSLFGDIFENILFTSSHWSSVSEDKVSMIKKINPDFYIDDYGKVAMDVQMNTNAKSILVNNEHTLYNSDIVFNFYRTIRSVTEF
jgi:uncharacterized HAD superfamily protein